MFGKKSAQGYVEILEGIRIKTICRGEQTLMTEFLLKKDSVLPGHSHPYEQTGYLISGKIRLHIEQKSREIKPGDSWCILEDELHKAEALEDSVVLEIFTPVREDYLDFINNSDVIL
jgi:quercetin dioxygenase-like cupin family protein